MAKKTAPLLPSTDELLQGFGDRLRLARLRRRLSAKQVAERAGMSPMTLRSLERGGSGVTMGAYLSVMQVLGIEKDLELLGQADPTGRQLQDARLPAHSARASRKGVAASPSARLGATLNPLAARDAEAKKQFKPDNDARDWIQQGGFASSETLVDLIESAPRRSKLERKRGR
jgi:transcriptional regulator with XRE-family HTH domain